MTYRLELAIEDLNINQLMQYIKDNCEKPMYFICPDLKPTGIVSEYFENLSNKYNVENDKNIIDRYVSHVFYDEEEYDELYYILFNNLQYDSYNIVVDKPYEYIIDIENPSKQLIELFEELKVAAEEGHVLTFNIDYVSCCFCGD